MIAIKVNNLSKNFKLFGSSGKSMLISIIAGMFEQGSDFEDYLIENEYLE